VDDYTEKADPTHPHPVDIAAMQKYRRAANYLAAAQIYLQDNPLLEVPLEPAHIKPRLLGHWGTAPGINLIYAHLNGLILRTGANVLLVTGPGHGAAANLANLYLEGTLTEYFPYLKQDRPGLKAFVKSFSWPHGFPSHLSPIYPGVISEGGELGYALATAFGAALDKSEVIVACIVGDDESVCEVLKASIEVPWRKPISSLNYLLTSEAWRQEHNGYSHQGPGFINNALTKKGHIYRVYFPTDANTLLVTMQHCLEVTNFINLIVAGKQPMPQWLTLDAARDHFRIGASVWHWASTHSGENPQIVLACCGDNLTLETLAAADLLWRDAPEWRVRVVNVLDLLVLGIPQKYPHGLDEDRFQRLFPLNVPVVFNFHGYTAAIKQLCWEQPQNERFDINGYREEGTTTTPFDMHIQNRTSRYHVVIQTAQKIAANNPSVAGKAEALILEHERHIKGHANYIRAHGTDPDEVSNWRWTR
jgi:phosphoketolase